ncbi:DNA-binding transcriptional regulator, LysR family [Duganella sp. CF402]|uniref:LysR family transcriptional regulator n=1 Tax=unclassified Duganella TaxID=2636909 RepID=UPI0008CC286F|nr:MULTISPECIES: LysR family transcriptional regulator [unclassified Duganella]RZT10908.1 DNA-binding transcriptional LysR family regulator [Duganella sp. BK701]SEK90680.1 DNA-binding transcriptional regulator, LysR family [Duganella sp. CF402]
MKIPRSTLEQWQVLQAIVECGGYAQAAEALHRSQSSVSYMVAKLQEQLGVELLEIDGRRARLTKNGEALLAKARELLGDAFQLEQLAGSLVEGWEPQVSIAVDSLFPVELLVQVLRDFEPWAKHTRVNLEETILSGSEDALLEKRVDLAIVSTIPNGFLGDALMDIEFVAVAHPCHPLHALGRELETDDLSRNLHIVVRDSGTNPRDHGWWLNSSQRWTVTSPHTRMEMICNGIGFGWLATHKIQKQLEEGLLKPLPLRVGQRRKLSLSLVVTNPELAGPAACRLANLIRKVVVDGIQRRPLCE